MRKIYISARVKLGAALGVASLASIGLYFAGSWGVHEHDFGYMIWNLGLAWTALAITLWLEVIIHRSLWSSWLALLVTFIWVVSLPNTFYMVTDFIHFRELEPNNLITGLVMLSSFIFIGVFLGLISLYIVHWELARRIKARTAYMLVELVLFICSYAIYIGRELRWNTWDIVANPLALLFDATDRLINPGQHPQALTITLSFFVFLSGLYLIMWRLMRAARQQPDL